MKKEKVTLEFTRYYVGENNDIKTCSADFGTDSCQFLATKCFGSIEVCAYTLPEIKLYRFKDEFGYLIPHKDCPLWNQ